MITNYYHSFSKVLKKYRLKEQYCYSLEGSPSSDAINYAKDKTLVICSTVRDVSKVFPHIKSKVYSITRYFREYKILFVENDSEDNSRQLLLNWASEDSNVVVLGCGINAQKCTLGDLGIRSTREATPKRIEKMVIIRNIYLDYINNHLSDFDLALFWDLDMVSKLCENGVLDSVLKFSNSSINCICSYGAYKVGSANIFYDNYAYIPLGSEEYPNLFTTFYLLSNPGKEIIPVTSCFSGASLYRVSALKGIRYEYKEKDNKPICEHVTLNEQLSGVYINPKMWNIILYNPL